MKKFILIAAAAGALAAGGSAFAQDKVIPGSMYDMMRVPPAAQTNPEGVRAQTLPSGQRVFIDDQGRQVYVDEYGRQVIPGIIGYDAWGRAIMGSSTYPGNYAYSGNYPYARSRRDRDGDGVPNRADRYPDDPRYR